MAKILKRNRLRFEKLITDWFLEAYHIECERDCAGLIKPAKMHNKIETPLGLLELRGFDADGSIYSFYTAFEDPSKLPGKQMPYQFARPDTHQTYSLGGDIYGWSFNGYSGKWNFNFGGHNDPVTVVDEIKAAFETLLQMGKEPAMVNVSWEYGPGESGGQVL